MFIPINYSLRSLWVRRTTTAATVLGIGLVVFVLAASLMLSEGLKRTLGSSGQPDRAIVLRAGSDAELSSTLESGTFGIIMAGPGVARDAEGPIATPETVIVLAMEKSGTAGLVSNVQVRGVTPRSYALRKELKMIEGRPIAPGTDEVVIGKSLVGNYTGMRLGQTFELKKNRPVTVVGVFEAGGSAFESEIWADIDTVRSSFGRGSTACSVLVQLSSRAAFDGFEGALEHDKQLGVDVFRETDYYEKQSEGTSIFINALGITVAVFFSIGAMIGATITMYAAVSQRAKEIGTLRALGFSRFAILTAFVLEALFLSLAGGVLGAIAGLAMSLVKFSMMNFATWQELTFSFQPTPVIMVSSVIAGGVMGFLGGFFPAIRAAYVSPIQAMRS